jgi:hypothetical protein
VAVLEKLNMVGVMTLKDVIKKLPSINQMLLEAREPRFQSSAGYAEDHDGHSGDDGITIRMKLGHRTRRQDSVNIRFNLLVLCIFAFSRNRKWTSTYPFVQKRSANKRRLLRHLWKRWNIKLDRQLCPGLQHFGIKLISS